MAKQGGLGDNLYIGGYDLSGDVGSVDNISGSIGVLDVTTIDKSANARLGGLRDGAVSFTSYFDPAAGASHPVLAALPTTDTILTYCRGTNLGDPAAALNGKQLNYDATRGEDGSFIFKVDAVGNAYGLEWGVQGTAGKRSDTTATNGTGVNLGAASSFGLQAYLQVFSFTGTSVTVKLQGSSDNGGGDAFADITGGAFAAASAIGVQRIATAGNLAIEQYFRVVTTGTFSQATFSVVVAVNATSVVF
jgi:hypothetical protein